MLITASEKKALLKSVEKSIIKSHGENTYQLKWVGKGKNSKYPTGIKNWFSLLRINAPDFNPATYCIIWDKSGSWTMTRQS